MIHYPHSYLPFDGPAPAPLRCRRRPARRCLAVARRRPRRIVAVSASKTVADPVRLASSSPDHPSSVLDGARDAGEVAHKRHHPQPRRFAHCASFAGFGGLLWPLAWLCAYTKPFGYKLPTPDSRQTTRRTVSRLRQPPRTCAFGGALESRGVPSHELTDSPTCAIESRSQSALRNDMVLTSCSASTASSSADFSSAQAAACTTPYKVAVRSSRRGPGDEIFLLHLCPPTPMSGRQRLPLVAVRALHEVPVENIALEKGYVLFPDRPGPYQARFVRSISLSLPWRRSGSISRGLTMRSAPPNAASTSATGLS